MAEPAPSVPPGFRSVDRSTSLAFANAVGAVVMLGCGFAGWALWRAFGPVGALSSVVLVLACSVGVVLAMPVHELLHLVGFRIAGAKWSDLRLGILWALLTSYASCRVPLPARGHALAAALPGLMLGVAPLLIGLAARSLAVCAWALVMIVAASGDALVIALLRDVPPDALVVDHPTRCGCLVLVPSPAAPTSGEARA